MSPIKQEPERNHSEEMHDIISKPPAWLLRWGLSLFFIILILIFGLSALIRYPDIVKTRLVINSVDSPKPIVSKTTGKLVKLLVVQNQHVVVNQPLAYLGSTAVHEKVLELYSELNNFQAHISDQTATVLNFHHNSDFGELQSNYQNFYQSYLNYKSTIMEGFFFKKMILLRRDLVSIEKQKSQLQSFKLLQEKDRELAKQEYNLHKHLFEQDVETRIEFQREEGKFLSKNYPLQQTETALLNNYANYSAKEKEIMELDNQIREEKLKFTRSLNSFLGDIENWKTKYILSASQTGKINFSGIIQENQVINANQDVFYVNSGNTDFFGEMVIPQYNMGKVADGQEVLVKLNSYPFEEYGILRGKIESIADIAYKNSFFVSRVSFSKIASSGLKKGVHLKNGMTADAEIITQNASLLQRLTRNIIKIFNQ